MLLVGLTGSIAMGKSTTARIFSNLGFKVFDADQTVHDLYQNDQNIITQIGEVCPAATKQGFVDRYVLSQNIADNKNLIAQIEQIVHPAVQKYQKFFVRSAKEEGEKFVVLDIPLLFETNQTKDVDKIIVVTTTKETQRTRALKRPNMTNDKLEFILSKQIKDEIKRQAADFIVDTSVSYKDAVGQVKKIIQTLINLNSKF